MGNLSKLTSTNPYSGQLIRTYDEMTWSEIEKIIASSEESFSSWKKTSLEYRNKLMIRLGELLRLQKDSLAELASLEMGKPIEQAQAEVSKCADLCDYYSSHSQDFLKNQTVTDNKEKFEYISYQPLGLILAVMPWNFPYWQVIRFAVPTLLAGNVSILKHASNVSGCALKLEELMLSAGFPKNVFSTLLVNSDKIEKIIHSPSVKAVSLTGSGPAGSAIAQSAGRQIKKTVLELGGSDPYLILADADIKKTAALCVKSRLQNNGQSCIAAKRFIVHENVYEEFKAEVIRLCKDQKTGDPLNPKTQLGPLAKEEMASKLQDQIKKTLDAGATLAYQSKGCSESKAFAPITILEDIPKQSPGYKEEFFGPVFLFFKFSSLQEAILVANDSSFGLGGGVFTSDLKLGQDIAEKMIDSGSVFVNSYTKSDPKLPFGGIKSSGMGRELSSLGIHEFVNIKSISVNKN